MKKLNAHGFAHHFALAFVVVATAIGGSYYLIASHADTCNPTSGPMSGPTSGPTSGSQCQPTSGPTSEPTSGGTQAGYCDFTNFPNSIVAGNSFTPSLTFGNTSNASYTLTLKSYASLSGSSPHKVNFKTIKAKKLAPGSQMTKTLSKYTVPANTNATTGELYASSTNPSFDCTEAFTVTPLKH